MNVTRNTYHFTYGGANALVVSPHGRYTKHIYIGSQRIVSKLGDLESFGQDPRRVARAGQNVDGKNGAVDYDGKYSTAQGTIKARYEEEFDLPYNVKPNDSVVSHLSLFYLLYCK